jgi:hypothetical protein
VNDIGSSGSTSPNRLAIETRSASLDLGGFREAAVVLGGPPRARAGSMTRGTPLPAGAKSDGHQGVSMVTVFCDEEVPPTLTQERSCRMRSP